MRELIAETHSSLRRRFKGDLLRPQHPGYEEARAVWNGMVAKKPGLIARCTTFAWGDYVLQGADSLPGNYCKPQGFSVLLNLDTPAEADRIFQRLRTLAER